MTVTEAEPDLVRSTEDLLRSLLPTTWRLGMRNAGAGRDIDAEFELADPVGSPIRLLLQAKRSIAGRDVEALRARLERSADASPQRALLMVTSRYIPEQVQQKLTALGVNYVDATGNVRLESTRPALFLRSTGAARDPWRARGRPRGGLRGRPAALVVRALADFAPPYTVPELIRLSTASSGATYRVVEHLAEEGLLRRDGVGRIVDVAWRPVLEAWARDYSFFTSNPVAGFLAPRGVGTVVDALRSVDADYAVTGSFAAGASAPYAPTRTLTVYAADVNGLARQVGLRAVDTGANVLIARPELVAVLLRCTVWNGVRITANSQTAVDLQNGPGRNPAESQALLDWMEQNEAIWRLTADDRNTAPA